MKTVLQYSTFEFMLLCFPAQFGVKWGDEKKPEWKNMTHQKKHLFAGHMDMPV